MAKLPSPKAAPSSPDPIVQMLREAGGSIDTMIGALIARAEAAEAGSGRQRPEGAAAIEQLTRRAEMAESKLAALKAMFA